MSKFKKGDLAFSLKDGFHKLEYDRETHHIWVHGSATYFQDGTQDIHDKHATLLTVEEAKRLGYTPP